MIEINLLPSQRKKKARAGVRLPEVGELLRSVREPLMVGAIGAWGLVLAAVAFVFLTQQAQLARLQEELDTAEAEARRYRALMVQKRRAERLRDSLVAELESIRRIDADRYLWPHILEEVTKALPDFTWLMGVEFVASGPAPGGPGAPAQDTLAARTVRFQIEGRTADIGAYTRFLRQLGNSPWITNVVPGPTQTVVEEAKPITAFTITAQFRQADSAYIRTVPVGESVR
jgi:Tfp pilus assembly protein PilN